MVAYLKTILAFAMAKPTAAQRLSYLCKGLLFAPWLRGGIAGKGSEAAANSQLGEDIYPLF
jgi:hypothetical protein